MKGSRMRGEDLEARLPNDLADLPIYETKDVAKLLKVSPDTITRAVRRGELSFSNLGTRRRMLRRFSIADIHKYLARKHESTHSPKEFASNFLNKDLTDYNELGLTAAKQPRKGGNNGSKS